jgi:hypothetical protein
MRHFPRLNRLLQAFWVPGHAELFLWKLPSTHNH